MIVLDASVLIGHLEAEDRHHHAATALLEAAVAEQLGVGVVTLAEVLVGPVRAGRDAQARSDLSDLGVREIPLPADAALRLARLRSSTRLALPDCSVLLTAQDSGAAVATFDDRLARACRELGLPVAV